MLRRCDDCWCERALLRLRHQVAARRNATDPVQLSPGRGRWDEAAPRSSRCLRQPYEVRPGGL